jgi:hypothetical protein
MVIRLGGIKPYECPCCGVKTHTTTNSEGVMVTYHGDPRCPFIVRRKMRVRNPCPIMKSKLRMIIFR